VRTPPVIVKLTDGNSNFRNISIGQRKKLHEDIFRAAGETKDSTILMGGDLAIYAFDEDQQSCLLNMKSLQGRPVSCPLPLSSTANKVGVIFGVPTSDSVEEIQEALADQQVIQVKRLPIRGRPNDPSETVLLTFSSSLPERVKITSMSYQVQISVPNAYRCIKCWRLGHTAARCGTTLDICKKCGKSHPQERDCSTRCVNCASSTHESSCNECPAYSEMKKVLKMAYLEGITVSEARSRVASLANASTKRIARPSNQDFQPPPEISSLQAQVLALKEEMRLLKESVIPKITKDIGSLAIELSETKNKIDHFSTRFDTWTTHLITMTNIPSNNFKCIQWNARGLSKAKLKEFRQQISILNPEVVLLSETHWNSDFAPKFKSHHILRKDRPNRLGGGVAILIRKSLQFTPLPITTPDTVEAIGVSILCTNKKHIDFISVYIPKDDCETADIELLLKRDNDFLVGGDLNGHHSLWEPNGAENKAGKSIYEALINDPNACLITPPNLNTRIDPASGKSTTIDLTLTSSPLSTSATINTGPYMGSDHLPVLITLNATLYRQIGRPASWILDENKWLLWNQQIENQFCNRDFYSINVPQVVTATFIEAIDSGNILCFKKTNPSRQPYKGQDPARPWWNATCQKLVKEARRAFRVWKEAPLCPNKRTEWKKAEAKKRKTIISAKKLAWTTFVSSLGPNDQPKMWSFVKNMVGKGSIPAVEGYSIRMNNKNHNTPEEKPELFLSIFSGVHPSGIPKNSLLESRIVNGLIAQTPNRLNDAITFEELDNSIPKSKSKAVGLDLIRNEMLKNLSTANKFYLLHLFNRLFASGYVPEIWKSAVVIPLLKQNKPAEDPNSYRPVSLTSCLGKMLERILANRLHWFLECKGLINIAQAGFRRGCSTTDHIAQLDSYIKTGFNQKKCTVATFLDISKAYDSMWIQGLMYKMANLGITGQFLGWVQEFLTGRNMCVRIGSIVSSSTPIENGVPQGAVLSPILFNIMLKKFPSVHPGCFEKAWTLTAGSSIFTAELNGILQALKHIYNLDDHPPEVIVFCDSSSAMQTVASSSLSDNEAVTSTRELIASLKSSGTGTTLIWIPSHTGIDGNEKVDKLASEECGNQNSNVTTNRLSPSEIISTIKSNWAASFLQSLRSCQKSYIRMRTRLGTIKWHQHNNRKVAICLHRLRSEHHYLNSFAHRIDQEADPSCRNGCEAIENSQHVLVACPKHEAHRPTLRQFMD
ncbi:Uncharacterized protein APZ42_029899, partial [Daphnia magna]